MSTIFIVWEMGLSFILGKETNMAHTNDNILLLSSVLA